MKLRFAENFRAVFYAPFYAMRELGLAEREGLEIDWLGPGDPGGAIDAVKRGEIDLTWGGPMRVMKDHSESPDNSTSLVSFCEVVGRDPFYLLGRAGQFDHEPAQASEPGRMDLRALSSLRLGVVSEVPTPWLCLQADLRALGVDPARLMASGSVRTGLSMSEQIQALREGRLDLVQVFEPFVSHLLAEGQACIVDAANRRGPTCYTTLITTRQTVDRQRAALAALVRAVARTQRWMAVNGSSEFARVVAPCFPEVSAAVLRSSLERYLTDGVWSTDPAVSREGFERLADSLLAGGFIGRAMRFEDCVVTP